MKYTLSWYVPNQVIYVMLEGLPDRNEAVQMDEEINHMLESYEKIIIILDIDNMKANYQTTDLLRVLTCVQHNNLDAILTLTENKLNRLMSLMAFGTSPTLTKQFATTQEIQTFLKQRNVEVDRTET